MNNNRKRLIKVSSIDIVVPRECAARSNREHIPTKNEALNLPVQGLASCVLGHSLNTQSSTGMIC
jgi:hypothetical protein